MIDRVALTRLLPKRFVRRGRQNHFAICKRRTLFDGRRKWLILRWVERRDPYRFNPANERMEATS